MKFIRRQKNKKGPATHETKGSRSGFVILFAIVMTSIILSVTFGVSSIALKELNFSTSAKETNDAFYAADIGAECAFMNDKFTSNSFMPTGGSGAVNCLGIAVLFTSSTASSWSFTLTGLGANAQNCAKVVVTKNFATNPITTTIDSKGYNKGDSSCNLSTNRVERNILATYGGDPNAASLVASPSTVAGGGQVTVTFNNIPTPTVNDYIGRYLASAGNPSAEQALLYTNNCLTTPGTTTRSFGSCVFTMPSTSGSYNFRAFANGNVNSLIVTSNAVTVGTPPSNFDLTITKQGSGTVTSNVGGINCGATCTANYALNTNVNLTAVASSGSVFTGWSGGYCAGTGTCGVTMSSNIGVTANFDLIPLITYVGSSTSTTTSIAAGSFPANQPGDLLLMFAYKSNGNTIPTVPVAAGWTIIGTGSSGSVNASVLAYKIATAGDTSTSGWTNATHLILQVYHGQSQTNPIGAFASSSASSNTISYDALTLTRTDGTSWVAGFAGHKLSTATVQNPPAGMSNSVSVVNGGKAAGHNTNGSVSSWGSQTVGVTANSGWKTRVVEILAP